MIFYISVFLLIVLLAVMEILLRKKKLSWFTGGLMSLVAGFRFYTGYDFLSYRNFFNEADSLKEVVDGSIDAESGYLFLNYLFSSIGLNYYFFVLVFALVSVGLLTNFLYRYTPYPSLFLMYYYARFFLVRDMGQIRSALACIILLYAIPYLIKRDAVKFLLVVFLASLFHVTALAFILAYLLNIAIKQLSVRNITGMLAVSTVIGLLVQIPQLYLWAVPGRYMAYFTNPAYTNGQWIVNPILWMQLLIFIGTILCYRPAEAKEAAKMDSLLKIYFIASLMLLLAGNLGTVGGRISTLFATAEILVVPYLFMNFSQNKLANLVLYTGFTAAIFLLIFVISGTYTEYIPYRTVFGF